MANRLATLIQHDVRLQWRYGIYIAYAFVIGFYVLMLVQLGDYLPSWIPALVIFTDPSVLGFFFIGALMMLEKTENTRNALAISPISAADYFWSKTITLTTIAIVAVLIIGLFVHSDMNWVLLMATVILTSIQFIAIAIPAALRFKTVTGYMIGSAGFMAPIVGPGFIALMDPMPLWAIIIPSASQFKLVLVAIGTHSASTMEITLMLAVCAIAAIATTMLALNQLKGEVG